MNEKAYDEVFKDLYKPLCFFVYKILLDQDKAEDIVQDNLLKLWQKRELFGNIEKIRSYLYVSVRNACYDEIEHQKVKDKYQQQIYHNASRTEQNILDIMMQAEVVNKVFAAVETLPEQCKKVIKMTFEEGKTPKEISDELGVTISTVSNQKMRGLIILKKRLSDKDVALATAILMPGLHWIAN